MNCGVSASVTANVLGLAAAPVFNALLPVRQTNSEPKAEDIYKS